MKRLAKALARNSQMKEETELGLAACRLELSRLGMGENG